MQTARRLKRSYPGGQVGPGFCFPLGIFRAMEVGNIEPINDHAMIRLKVLALSKTSIPLQVTLVPGISFF